MNDQTTQPELPAPTPMSEANRQVKAAMSSAAGATKQPAPAKKAAVKKAPAKKAPAKKAPAKKTTPKPAAAEDWKPPSNPEIERHLKVIEDFANQLDKAESTADRDTLAVGEALSKLYNDPDDTWAREFAKVKPAKPNAAGKIEGKSKARFAGWLKWRAEQRRRSAPASTYCWRLLKAHETATRVDTGNAVQPATEGQIRPLNWLVQNGHGDAVNEVWGQAVELAKVDKRKAPNVSDVKTAVANFKAKLPKEAVKRVTREKKAEQALAKAKAAVQTLWAADKDNEGAPRAKEFHVWYKDWASKDH